MKKIKGVLIKNGNVKEYDFEYESYKDFYSLLDTSCFDIVRKQFGKFTLDVYCDDEALIKKELPLVSLARFDNFGNIIDSIFGNVFICNHNVEGETISLTDEEITSVLKNRVLLESSVTGKLYDAVRVD